MQTRCPYPPCASVFETNDDRTTNCPACGRLIAVRPLDVLFQVDKMAAKQSAVGRLFNSEPSPGGSPRLSVLVEDVRSLWNVGSIFRSADGAGFEHIYLVGICGTPPRKEIAKTSLGAEDHVGWSYAPCVTSVLPILKERGTLIVGLERLDSASPFGASMSLADALANASVRLPLCLVVGNEVTGLSPEALAACDIVAHLPMRGIKESLNVAVAFGIASYMISERLAASELKS